MTTANQLTDKPTPWVMFGRSRLLADYVDAIHANGGYLARIAVAEADGDETADFDAWLARYQAWLTAHHPSLECCLVSLDRFEPEAGEQYLLGPRDRQGRALARWSREAFSLRFTPLIHPTAVVAVGTEVHEGAFLGARSNVASWVEIGEFACMLAGSSLGHDSVMHPFATIGEAAVVASFVTMEVFSRAGPGSSVRELLVLHEGCELEPGAALVKDAPAWSVLAGVPARVSGTREFQEDPDAEPSHA